MNLRIAGPALCRPGARSAAKALAAIARKRPGLRRRRLQELSRLGPRFFRAGVEHALELGWLRRELVAGAARYFARELVAGDGPRLLPVEGPRRAGCARYSGCLAQAARAGLPVASCPEGCGWFSELRRAV